MHRIRIGTSERPLEEATESWIAQQLNERRKEGQSVCVQVILKTSGIDMVLSTPACGNGSGASRAPNPRESEIFTLWEKRGLRQPDFTAGNVIAFVKQVLRLL
jgi:hypothetical protein